MFGGKGIIYEPRHTYNFDPHRIPCNPTNLPDTICLHVIAETVIIQAINLRFAKQNLLILSLTRPFIALQNTGGLVGNFDQTE